MTIENFDKELLSQCDIDADSLQYKSKCNGNLFEEYKHINTHIEKLQEAQGALLITAKIGKEYIKICRCN